MLVLKILGIIVLAFILICCIFEINERCKKRFKVPLFSKNITVSLFLSSLFIIISKIWYHNIIKTGKGDLLNPQIIIGLSSIVIIYSLIDIYRKTNLIYGTIGIIFYGVFCLILYFGILAFLIVVIFSIIFSTPAKPVNIRY